MTKAELIEALQPFMDETEIMIGDKDRWFEVDKWSYAVRFNGYGCFVLDLGARILLRSGGINPQKRKYVPCGETGHTVPDEKGNCFQCGLPVTALEGGTANAPCSLTNSQRCNTYPNCPCGGVA